MSRPQFTSSTSETDYIAVPLRRLDRSIGDWTVIDLADAWALESYKWFKNPEGYAVRVQTKNNIRTTVFLAREILRLPRKKDGREADHRNRNKLDNRRRNLRILTKAQNLQNKNNYRGTRSQFRGVSWDEESKKWRARLQVGGVSVYLGRFSSEEDAAKATREARQRLMPYAID